MRAQSNVPENVICSLLTFGLILQPARLHALFAFQRRKYTILIPINPRRCQKHFVAPAFFYYFATQALTVAFLILRTATTQQFQRF